MAHAKLSPSSASRWMTCQASVVMQEGKADPQNVYSAEGTAAHFLAERCLLTDKDADHYLDDKISVRRWGDCHLNSEMDKGTYDDIEFSFKVDDDMVEYVNEYLSLVRSVRDSVEGELLVEQRLPLEDITGEKNAKGTSDVVILADKEIIVIDLKYGQGDKTDAVENPQLMIYGLSALLEFDIVGDFEAVRLIISQPRRQHVSEWVISAEDLRAFGDRARAIAANVLTLTPESDLTGLFEPSATACKYCKARFDCKAFADKATTDIAAHFDDLDAAINKETATFDDDRLVELFKNINLYKLFTKTLDEAMYNRLQSGHEMEGFKLVKSKGGRRKWLDDDEAEDKLKRMKLKVDERYKRVLISPTEAEKLVKSGKIGGKQWEDLQDFITKSEGKPTIAPSDDKRNAIIPTVEMFDILD